MEGENVRTGKRSPCDGDYLIGVGKKRRKQLKPVRIAAIDVPDSLPSTLMVQVPKDELVSCSEPAASVPHAKPLRCPLRDVPFQNDILSDGPTTTTTASNVPIPDSGPSVVVVSSPTAATTAAATAVFQPSFPFPYHHPWSDRSHKIFNQEAYCELCKKEFCNKYFLKTHKANKHGIYSDNNGTITTVVSAIPTTIEPIVNEDDGDKNGKAFCDLCNKSFCNKYFVRKHKTKSHGIEDLDDTGASLSPSSQLTAAPLESGNNLVQTCSTNDATSTLYHDNQDFSTDIDEPLNLVVANNTESEASSEDGNTENLEKLQTMLLRLRPDADIVIDENDDDSGGGGGGGDLESATFQPDVDQITRKNNNKPTSSYCEICNKELCNKYFMRTHMQRMHGIELEHGAQIGGVVCNICNKELCSKYFLRVHKQNTHGIPGPTGLPNTIRTDSKIPNRSPAFTQICLICNKRFRSSKWLQAHLQSDHREIPETHHTSDAPVDVISKLLWEGGGSGNAAFSCSHCPFTTPVLAFLFVHERSHVAGGATDANELLVKPSQALQELIHHKTFWQHAIITQPTTNTVGLDLTAPTRNPTS